MNDQAVLVAVLRNDLRFFIWKCFQTILPGTPYLRNWHIDAIVYQLLRVQAGDLSRLLINQPPRSLKSICVSVAFVAWRPGQHRASPMLSCNASMRMTSPGIALVTPT